MARIIRTHIKTFNLHSMLEQLEALSVEVKVEWRGFEIGPDAWATRAKLSPVRRLITRNASKGRPVYEDWAEPGEVAIRSDAELSTSDTTLLDSLLAAHDPTTKSRFQQQRETDASDLEDVDTKYTAGLNSLSNVERNAVLDKVVRLVLREHGKQD